jgi:hypothetical protein
MLGVTQVLQAFVLPLLARRGGSSGTRKRREASLPRDGVVVPAQADFSYWNLTHHPVCSAKDASRNSFGRSQPSRPGEPSPHACTVTFELLVATRYLRAKRKQAMISVITVIAMLGVSAGVGALVVAMAVSEGQRQDIRDKLLGAQAHVTIYSAGREGIRNYIEVAKEIEKIK